jgi:hypothetical protein
LAALACTHSVDPISAPDGEPIIVSALDGQSIIVNQTGKPIHFWIVDRNVLAVINYTLRRRADSPDRLEPLQQAVLKIEEIYGYEPDEIRTIVVKL